MDQDFESEELTDQEKDGIRRMAEAILDNLGLTRREVKALCAKHGNDRPMHSAIRRLGRPPKGSTVAELAKDALDLCYQIEKCGASEELTKASLMASELRAKLEKRVSQLN